MPGDDEDDADFIHDDHYESSMACGVIGCSRFCAPNYLI